MTTKFYYKVVQNISSKIVETLQEAMFYRVLDNKSTMCLLCPRKCTIPKEKVGFCRNRKNIDGRLFTLVYNKPCSVDIGPIEKAPLFHFYPGHKRLCISTVGCNLRCKYCQNWYISQVSINNGNYQIYSPAEIITLAKKNKLDSISFTYTEPTVFYEYMYNICCLAKKEGFKTSIVSNGYINPAPLRQLIKVMDGIKIDLKSFNAKFYKEICSAELSPVLKTLQVLKEENKFFEIVNLIIPTLNDDPEEIKQMCLWIIKNLGDEVPLHFTRFTPEHKLTHLPPTPVKTLTQAIEIAQNIGLKYVYIGNIPGHKYECTFCPNCNKLLIHRIHFTVLENNIIRGLCKFCHYQIAGIWE